MVPHETTSVPTRFWSFGGWQRWRLSPIGDSTSGGERKSLSLEPVLLTVSAEEVVVKFKLRRSVQQRCNERVFFRLMPPAFCSGSLTGARHGREVSQGGELPSPRMFLNSMAIPLADWLWSVVGAGSGRVYGRVPYPSVRPSDLKPMHRLALGSSAGNCRCPGTSLGRSKPAGCGRSPTMPVGVGGRSRAA